MEDWREAFTWHSSEIDWCEPNYAVTEYIVEFWNTISNVLFFIFPVLMIYLFREYNRVVKQNTTAVWLLIMAIGIGSVYFHLSLTLAGQLLDELAILWVILTALKMFNPYLMPNNWVFTAVFFLLTCSAFVMPVINRLFLFLFALPTTYLLVTNMNRTRSVRVKKLGRRCLAIFLFAVCNWLIDRLACDYIAPFELYYLHAVWHVCVAVVAYQTCVLFAYFHASELERTLQLAPVIKLWPSEVFGFCGIPYVAFAAKVDDLDSMV